MSARMRKRKAGILILACALCLILSGCRVRTAGNGRTDGTARDEAAGVSRTEIPGSLPDGGTEESGRKDEQEKNEEPGGRTKENPEASRKEYDEAAPAEITAGTERRVHGAGEGGGMSAASEDAREQADRLNDGAEETAVQTVAADEAEQAGVSEDAEEADSAMTYYTVLLQDRMGSLFECQRLNVYWETAEDHVTVFRTSPEHSLILAAGAYDVSARLLEENLRVDDGWVRRKNPGLIVKIAEEGILGPGAVSADAARKIRADLTARDGWAETDAVRNGRVLVLSECLLERPDLRVAAALMIAKAAAPGLMADVDIDRALEMLSEEATGSVPSGVWYYGIQGGS